MNGGAKGEKGPSEGSQREGGCNHLPLDVGRARLVQLEELLGGARGADGGLAVDRLRQVGDGARRRRLHLAELGGRQVEQQLQDVVVAHGDLRVVDGRRDVGDDGRRLRLDVGVGEPRQRVHDRQPAVRDDLALVCAVRREQRERARRVEGDLLVGGDARLPRAVGVGLDGLLRLLQQQLEQRVGHRAAARDAARAARLRERQARQRAEALALQLGHVRLEEVDEEREGPRAALAAEGLLVRRRVLGEVGERDDRLHPLRGRRLGRLRHRQQRRHRPGLDERVVRVLRRRELGEQLQQQQLERRLRVGDARRRAGVLALLLVLVPPPRLRLRGGVRPRPAAAVHVVDAHQRRRRRHGRRGRRRRRRRGAVARALGPLGLPPVFRSSSTAAATAATAATAAAAALLAAELRPSDAVVRLDVAQHLECHVED